ncbi:MAG: DoxX family membrane protein [Deltaproteobacteria bacterium]|nr:DoxX family membrane protein [Deltaproteobacteria bacterium]
MKSRFQVVLSHPLLLLLLRLFLAFVLIGAAWPKILCPASFSVSVAAYRVAPASIINLAAVCIPWIEFLTGLGLLAGYRTRSFAVLTVLLMTLFCAVIVLALARGVTAESCGCNVPGFSEELGPGTLARDVLFLSAALYLVFFKGGKWSLDRIIKS